MPNRYVVASAREKNFSCSSFAIVKCQRRRKGAKCERIIEYESLLYTNTSSLCTHNFSIPFFNADHQFAERIRIFDPKPKPTRAFALRIVYTWWLLLKMISVLEVHIRRVSFSFFFLKTNLKSNHGFEAVRWTVFFFRNSWTRRIFPTFFLLDRVCKNVRSVMVY